MKNYSLLLFIGIFLWAGSAYGQKDKEANKNAVAARKALKGGEFLEAIDFTVKAARGEPNKRNQKNLFSVLSEATDSFYKQFDRMIAQYSFAELPSNWDKDELRRMRSLADWYQNGTLAMTYLSTLAPEMLSDAGISRSQMIDYSTEYSLAMENFSAGLKKFAEAQMALATELMGKETKPDAYKAYQRLSDINDLDRNYPGLAERMDEAKKAATVNLVFLEFYEGFRDRQSYTGNISNFSSLSSFEYHTKQQKSPYGAFIRVKVMPDQENLWLNKDNQQVVADFCSNNGFDGVVFGSLERPQFNYLDDKPVSREIEKEVTISEQKVKKADGTEETVKQTAKVKATRITYSRQERASIVGRVIFYDAINQRYVIQEQASQGEYLVTRSWENATGDLRVFSEREQKSFTARPPDRTPEPDLQNGAIGDLAKKVVAQAYSWVGKLYE